MEEIVLSATKGILITTNVIINTKNLPLFYNHFPIYMVPERVSVLCSASCSWLHSNNRRIDQTFERSLLFLQLHL